jgi:hypothetical protein
MFESHLPDNDKRLDWVVYIHTTVYGLWLCGILTGCADIC